MKNPALNLAEDLVETLSLEEIAAQMLMIDFTGYDASAVRDHLSSRPWGGYILFAKNIRNRNELARLNADLMEIALSTSAAIPPLIGLDQEGGVVNRVTFSDIILSPGNMALAATGDPDSAYEACRISGRQLRQLGFHLNFAPCVDVNVNPLNPIIGVRSFSEDPAAVALFGVRSIQGYRDGGIAPTVKHFPGHGDTSLDSHLALPRVDFDEERLKSVELLPFESAIRQGVEAVMTAHIIFSAYDARNPATLSRPILTGLLRQKMGFEGVIFTDALSMKAISDHYGAERGAALSVQAGCDMLLACGEADDQERMIRAIVRSAEEGTIDIHDLKARVRRIMALKRKFIGGFLNAPFSETGAAQTIKRIALRSVTVLRNSKPLLPIENRSARILIAVPEALVPTGIEEMAASSLRRSFSRYFSSVEEVTVPQAKEDSTAHVLQMAQAADVVIHCLYTRNVLPQKEKALAASLSSCGAPVITVALGSPYVFLEIPSEGTHVCLYNHTPSSLDAFAEVCAGLAGPGGRIPVTLPGLFPRGHGITW